MTMIGRPGPWSRRQALVLLSAAGVCPAAAVKAQAPALSEGPARTPSVVDTAGDDNDRMTVPVFVNGQGPYPFIVDTASERTTVSQTLAMALALPTIGTLNVDSATGLDIVPGVRIDRLQMGPREIRGVNAPVFRQDDIGAAGLLGLDALSGQNIVMDFVAKRMTIQPSAGRDQPGDVIVYGKSRYGQLILVDAAVDGRDLYVVIDTGGEMSIGNSTLRRLVHGPAALGAGADVDVLSVSGDKAQAQIEVLPRVRLGGVQINNLPIGYADIHTFDRLDLRDRPSLLLGMDVLRKFERVSVDFKARRVRFLLSRDSARPASD